ncbi:MAG: hypothetical protein R3277_10005, partial [Brumimicrobium sp.]|nr:hypothetical protein [Brumimicrobium sp.]
MKIASHFKENTVVEHIEKRYDSIEIPQNLRLILKELTSDSEAFDPEMFYQFSMNDIFSYLKASHQYYLNTVMPKIENVLFQLMSALQEDNRESKVFLNGIYNYKRSLQEHIDLEEKILFKYVAEILEGNQNREGTKKALNLFLQTHDDHLILDLDPFKAAIIHFNSQLKGNLTL